MSVPSQRKEGGVAKNKKIAKYDKNSKKGGGLAAPKRASSLIICLSNL